jgi:CRISPR-associated endonuclease/helicase Cas3
MAQRFGRVNRFGNNTDTEIHVVHPKSEDFDEKSERDTRRKRTLVLLRELNGEASPAALGQIDPEKRQAAYTPTPTILPTSDILFDAWSLTSIRGKLPGRPPVEPYLHGLADWEPPQTHIAWREEVEVLDCVSLPGWKPKDLTDLLAEYPLKPHELLCDRSDRVFKVLEALAKKHPDVPAWIVTDDGEVTPTTMAKLADKDNKEQINNQTILLAPKVGGLTNGLLDAGSVTANDVSSGEFYVNEKGDSRRLRVWDEEDVGPNMRFILTIDTNPDADETETEGSGKRYWHWYELRDGGDNEGLKNSKFPVAWQTHTDDVVGQTTSIAKKLRPSLGELANSLILAAKLHDLGKKRKLFQVVLGNRQNPQRVFAKSGKGGGRIAEKYRHEFGSLIDAKSDAEFAKLTEDEQDFVLHIIATHHGRGRPHFDADEAFDPERTDDAIRAVACEVPRRFARLQRKYGRWGLAYLESLLRAGDYAASAAPSKFEENQ